MLLFAQDTITEKETLDTINNVISTNVVPDFFTKLDTPKIIKNNVRVNDLTITNTAIDVNNQLVVEGTVEIRNYADTPTSRLYMTSYLGIKGTGYYLQYPLYRDERSEAFILEPKQSIIKTFKVIEENFLAFGAAGFEVAVFDEYDKRVHAEATSISSDTFPVIKEKGTLFTDVDVRLMVGDKKFIPNNGPTFYPEKEDMFLNLDFKKTFPVFLENLEVKVFKRNFFTPPIQEFTSEINSINKKTTIFNIPIPEDLAPGVYPFSIEFGMQDPNIKIPNMYGRFIVGGNMGKVLDVSLDTTDTKTNGIIVVVQGNAPDVQSFDRDKDVLFDVDIFVYGKNNILLTQKTLTGQNVQIYRNLEINLDMPIRESKIYKVKVDLKDEKSIFDTYSKEFPHKGSVNMWHVALIFLAALLILILLFSLWLKKKNNTPSIGSKTQVQKNIITGCTMLLLSYAFLSVTTVEAGISPSAYQDLGVWVQDGDNSYSSYDDYLDPDVGGMGGGEFLDYFGIDVTFDQPIFFNQDSSHCYYPGQLIPLSVNINYSICTNSTIASSADCTGLTGAELEGCQSGSGQLPYLYFYTGNSDDWFWNLRDWKIDKTAARWVYRFGSVGYDPDLPFYKQFDLGYLSNFVAELSATNSDVWRTWIGISPDFPYNNMYEYNHSADNQAINDLRRIWPWPWYADQFPVSINGGVTSYAASGGRSYSLMAPEKPGIYTFPVALSFNYKTGGRRQGLGFYAGQYQIRVCGNDHDVDFMMPGLQKVNSAGEVEDAGIELTGYTVQKYTDTDSISDSLIDRSLGSIDDPDNEVALLTLANYCGSKSLGTNPNTSYFNTFDNLWANFLSGTGIFSSLETPIFAPVNASDSSQMAVLDANYDSIYNHIFRMPSLRSRIPLYGYISHLTTPPYLSADTGTPYKASKRSSPQIQTFYYEYVIKKVGNDIKFVPLKDQGCTTVGPCLITQGLYDFVISTYSDTTYSALISGAKTFPQAFQDGLFETYLSNPNIKKSDPIENISLVKENLTIGNDMTTCTVYEDFCPSIPGIQYLLMSEDGYKYEVWNILETSNHVLLGTTSRTSTQYMVDLQCSGQSYLVTYDSQSATTPANPTSQVVTSPATTIGNLPTPPIKTGYDFGGWYTSTNGGGTQFLATTPVINHITVFAFWKIRPPTGLTVTPSTCGTNFLTISWDAMPGVYRYSLYRKNSGGGRSRIYYGTSTSYIDNNLTLGTTYTYELEWTNTAYMESDTSATVSNTLGSGCPFICTGNTPANADLCTGDDTELTSFVPRSLVTSCTVPTKCEYTCETGYVKDPSTGLCIIPQDGQCGPDVYTCIYPTWPTIPDPGFDATQFLWSCLGDSGKNHASCNVTCPAGSSPDILTQTCISDFCLNIAGSQDVTYVTSNDLFRDSGGNCYPKLTVTCSGAPLSASIGQEVTWTPVISGGEPSPNNFNYSWYGSDADYDYAFYSYNPIAPFTYTTPGTKTAYLEVYDENWQQHAYAECEIMMVSDASNCEKIIVHNATTFIEETPTTPGMYRFDEATSLNFICQSKIPLGTPWEFGFKNGSDAKIPLFVTEANWPLPGLNLLSDSTADYQFTGGATTVSCYAPFEEVVSGSSCAATICIGTAEECAAQPYTLQNPLVPNNIICTNEPTTNYILRCDNASPLVTDCNTNLYTGLNAGFSRSFPFRINGTIGSYTITCGGATAATDSVGCSVDLPSGAKIEIETAPSSGMYQEIQGSTLDDKDPIPSIAYYTDYVSASEPGTVYSPTTQWTNEPVTAVLRCQNDTTLGDNTNDICSCASDTLSLPSWDIHDATLLPDILFFFHTFSSETVGQTITISDTATNTANTANQPIAELKIDTVLPQITLPPVPSGISDITFTFIDLESGIVQWKVDTDPVDCSVPGGEISVTNASIGKTITDFDPATQELFYCIRDLAGNVTAGVYPNDTSAACFSDDSTSVDLTNYEHTQDIYGLWDRVNASLNTATEKRGYLLSDPARRAQTLSFQSKLANNINTYITSKYCSTQLGANTVLTLSATADDGAQIKPLISPFCKTNPLVTSRNKQGYYYYEGNGNNRVLTITQANGTTITKPIVIYAVGANIQIDHNLEYNNDSGTPSLVIIAQRDSAGNGGSIYVDPSVTHIDATLIADGALMNGAIVDGVGSFYNWISNTQELMASIPGSRRLIINGRLLTYNTRGGSLAIQNGILTPIDGRDIPEPIPTGYCANGPTIVPGCPWDVAAAQDLERFRFEPNANSPLCTLHVTGSLPEKRPDILTTLTY